MFNFMFSWINEPQSIPTIPPPPNSPIIWDYDGSILSYFEDNEWRFPALRKGSYHTIYWPEPLEITLNKQSAKELAIVYFTHGNFIKPATASAAAVICRRLNEFCNSNFIQVQQLPLNTTLLIDFFFSLTNIQKIGFITLSRSAITHKTALQWEFIDKNQINNLTQMIVLEHKQTPVVPVRICNKYQTIATQITEGFLRISDEFHTATLKWINHSVKLRNKGKPGYWPTILASHPNLKSELAKWCTDINNSHVRAQYIGLIYAAAFWLIAIGSCARKNEILHLKAGCLSISEHNGDKIYFLIGQTTKTQKNDKAIWIVSPIIEIAIITLENLLQSYKDIHAAPGESDYLFQVLDSTYGTKKSPSQQRLGKKLSGQPLESVQLDKLSNFVDDTVTVQDIEWASFLTPSLNRNKFKTDHPWPMAAHQLRRTTLMHAAASGIVSQDSIAFQAKHKTWQMSAYYCQQFWKLIITTPDDQIVSSTDKSLAEEFSKVYVDSYNKDRNDIFEKDRFFSMYGIEHKRKVIEKIPLLSLQEIKAGESQEVLKRNTLGICTQREYCEFQSALSVRGCLTKADGQPCAQAIIDSNRIPELKALIQDLRYRLEEVRARDIFEREQLEADIASTQLAIEIIAKHKENTDAS